MRKKDATGRFVAVLAFIVILLVLFASFTQAPVQTEFTASSPGEVSYATGAYVTTAVTTNAVGQTVTTAYWVTGAYVTTGTATATATTTAATTAAASTTATTGGYGLAWLQITIDGAFRLLNPDGNPVESQTIAIMPYSGSTDTVDSLAVDATYNVAGSGVDWSTLRVDCGATGAAQQPSTANPDTPETVNSVPTLNNWVNQKVQSGRLALTTAINTLTGGKSWDHNRKLTASVGLICTATAKRLPGYEVVGGGDTVTTTVGPLVGQAYLKWSEPIVVTTTAATSTAATTIVATTANNPAVNTYVYPTTSVSNTYGANAATNTVTQPATVTPTYSGKDSLTCPAGYFVNSQGACILIQAPTSTTTGASAPVCLRSGTLVLLVSGRQVPVETIRVGDRVLSLEPGTMKLTSATVTAVSVHQVTNYYRLMFAEGSTLDATGEHPILTSGGFILVRQLTVGAVVYKLDGNSMQVNENKITSITRVTGDPTQVYSLTVTEPNTYFANQIVAHNKPAASSYSGAGPGSAGWSGASAGRSGTSGGFGGAFRLLGLETPHLEIYGAEQKLGQFNPLYVAALALIAVAAFLVYRQRRARRRRRRI